MEQLLAANARLHQLDQQQAADAVVMSEQQRATVELAAAVACAVVEGKAAAAVAANRDSELVAGIHRAAADSLALVQQVQGLEARIQQSAARGVDASTNAAASSTVDVVSRLQVSLLMCAVCCWLKECSLSAFICFV